MPDKTPKPSQTDEELRRKILKAWPVRFVSGVFKQKQYSNDTVSPGEQLVQEIVGIPIDDLMALIQADRERLYGELVAALPPEIDIASRRKLYQIKDTADNNEGLQQMWYDHGQTDTVKRTKAAVNKVFNREEADDE